MHSIADGVWIALLATIALGQRADEEQRSCQSRSQSLLQAKVHRSRKSVTEFSPFAVQMAAGPVVRSLMSKFIPEDNAFSDNFEAHPGYTDVTKCYQEADARRVKQLRRKADLKRTTSHIKSALEYCPDMLGVNPCGSAEQELEGVEDFMEIGDELANVLQPNCDQLAAEQTLGAISNLSDSMDKQFGQLSSSIDGMSQKMEDLILPVLDMATRTLSRVEDSIQTTRDSEHRLAKRIQAVQETTEAILLRLDRLHQDVSRNHLELLQNRYSAHILTLRELEAKVSGAESDMTFAWSQLKSHKAALLKVRVEQREIESWLAFLKLRTEQVESSLRAGWTTVRDSLVMLASLIESDFLQLHYDLSFRHHLHSQLVQLPNCLDLKGDTFMSDLLNTVKVQTLGADPLLLSIVTVVMKGVGISSMMSVAFPTDTAILPALDASVMAVAEALQDFKSQTATVAPDIADLLRSELPAICPMEPGCVTAASKAFPDLVDGWFDLGSGSVAVWLEDKLREFTCNSHPAVLPAGNLPDDRCNGDFQIQRHVDCPVGYNVPSRFFDGEPRRDGHLDMSCIEVWAGHNPAQNEDWFDYHWEITKGTEVINLPTWSLDFSQNQFGPFGCEYAGNPWDRLLRYRSERSIDQDHDLFDGVDSWARIIDGVTHTSQEFHWMAVSEQYEIVSLGKSAVQSTTWGGRAASFAVDGHYSNVDVEKCSHTNNTDHSWWRVDLGRIYLIAAVSMTNSLSNSERLHNPRVHILGSEQAVSKPFVGTVDTEKNGGTVFFDPPVYGSAVHIVLDGDYLALCEVQVVARKMISVPSLLPALPPHLVALRKHTGYDEGRYLAAASDERDVHSSWAWVLDYDGFDSAIDNFVWEVVVSNDKEVDSDGVTSLPIVQLKKHGGSDAGRYLTAHSFHLSGNRDTHSSWALVHDGVGDWVWEGKGDQVKLRKKANFDAGRYLTSHGSHGEGVTGSRALVHDTDDDDSLWDVIAIKWQDS